MGKKNVIFLCVLMVLFLNACNVPTVLGDTLKEDKNEFGSAPINNKKVQETSDTTESFKEPYTFYVKNVDETRMGKENLSDYYITNIGDSGNLYTIDEQNILWGSGYNQYGQLGQGVIDNKFYQTPIKIAEDVIHVDYSFRGFAIFLTKEGTLYGLGNNGTGSLMYLDQFSSFTFVNGQENAISTPRLLMTDISYARCGREDVVAIKSDESVWTWGVTWYDGSSFSFRAQPEKILDEVSLVTGGPYNHAAIKSDGTVWTWGYNLAGSCGINNEPYISEPRKVAENVEMVWTGNLSYNVDFYDISEAVNYEQRALENTIVQKKDGSFWACGINIGELSNIISPYYEAEEYEVIYTYKFYPCLVNQEIGQ